MQRGIIAICVFPKRFSLCVCSPHMCISKAVLAVCMLAAFYVYFQCKTTSGQQRSYVACSVAMQSECNLTAVTALYTETRNDSVMVIAK